MAERCTLSVAATPLIEAGRPSKATTTKPPRTWRMALVLFRQLNVGFLLFRILIVVLLLLLTIRTVFNA